MRGIPGGDVDPVADFWLVVFIVTSGVILFVIHKLTDGYIFAYSKAKVNKNLIEFLKYFHFISTLILAFFLPNNYLIRFKFFQILIKQDDIWIGISVVVLFIILMVLVGILLTLLLKRKLKN